MLSFSLFLVPLSSQAETLENERLHNSQLVSVGDSQQGTLPSGIEFTFGEPLYTNEFSEDDTFEWVTIEDELQVNSDTQPSDIAPRRIEPGWAKYIIKAYWIDRSGVKSISIYPDKGASGWTKEKAFAELKSNFSHYYDWKNEASLKKQFNCHARPIPPYTGKIPWNIEPSKSATNVLTCN